MAHIRNLDIRVMTVAVATAGAIAIIADLFMRIIVFGGFSGGRSRRGSSKNDGALALIALVGFVVVVVLAPLAAGLLRAAVSRSRERLADASAVELTRDPSGIRRALEKLQAETLGFHQQLGVELPVYADPVAYTRSWVAAILPGGLGYPTTLLIDRRGMIQDAVVGYRSGEMKRLAGRIETLKKS
jgi:Zn-dependent protease with chaperone function